MIESFAVASLTGLSDSERDALNANMRQLATFQPSNLVKQAYYTGTQRVRDLGIAIPPVMRSIETVVGWPETVVDVLEERMNFEGFGWPDEDDRGLSAIVDENHLIPESSQGITDSLIYGVDFICVGSGMNGEPDPLVTFESPLNTTGIWSARARRLTSAVSVKVDEEDGRPVVVTLYLPDETITAEPNRNGGFTVTNRDEHRLGRVPVVRMANRPRTADLHGRSEITRAVRAYTDIGVRTLLGMEVAREFYAAPQRYLLGASESAFVGPDGENRTAWETYLGRMLAFDPGVDEMGNPRDVKAGQFPAATMEPFIGQMQLLASMVASASGMPSSYLGFHTDNPPSADGTRALEARLVKRAERRDTSCGVALVEAARMALLIRDGDPGPAGLHARWADPATPTIAATTDAVVKQVQAGILPARSEVTLTKLGYSPSERARITADAAADPLTLLASSIGRASTPQP